MSNAGNGTAVSSGDNSKDDSSDDDDNEGTDGLSGVREREKDRIGQYSCT